MILDQIKEALMKGDCGKVTELVRASLDANVTPKKILDDGLIAGMEEIGRRFKNNEIFIPEVLIAAEAMNGALTILEPHLVKSGVKPVIALLVPIFLFLRRPGATDESSIVAGAIS